MQLVKNVEDQNLEFPQEAADKTRKVTLANCVIPGCFKYLFYNGGVDIRSFLNSICDFYNGQISAIEDTLDDLGVLEAGNLPFFFSKETGQLTLIATENQYDALKQAGKLCCEEDD